MERRDHLILGDNPIGNRGVRYVIVFNQVVPGIKIGKSFRRYENGKCWIIDRREEVVQTDGDHVKCAYMHPKELDPSEELENICVPIERS